MVTEHEAWLALTVEEPLEPDLPICDPHHHLWDRPGNRYLLDELLQDIGGGHNITSTVFVQCGSMYRKDGPEEMKPVGEVEFVQGVAAQAASGQYGPTRVAAGIIGFANLTLGTRVTPVLEAHLAASRNRFRGIRQIAAWDASDEIVSHTDNPRLMSEPKFREGLGCLQKYNLSFEACVYHPQLMELADLVKVFPDLPIIVEHIGDPLGIGPYTGKRDEVFQEWKRGIAALAPYPNLFMKLGALGMPNRGFGWYQQSQPPGSVELAAAMAPYYLTCIEQFGPERCMFESNFPVDKQSYSYTVMWNAFKLITEDFSAAERSALFHDTAVKAYRLAD